MQEEQTSYSAVLGVVLKSLRMERSIEQGQMAKKMGLSQPSYSRLESGKSAFSLDQMFYAARVLGVSEQDITEKVNHTVANLRDSGVKVLPLLRASTSEAKQKDGKNEAGKFIAGAALGALLVGILANR